MFLNDKVDANSRLPDGREVHNLNDLKEHLVKKRLDDVVQCRSTPSVYAIGRSLTYNEDRILKRQCLNLREKDYGMLDIVKFIITSDLFLKK